MSSNCSGHEVTPWVCLGVYVAVLPKPARTNSSEALSTAHEKSPDNETDRADQRQRWRFPCRQRTKRRGCTSLRAR